jgi:RNase P subunit RPR2
MEKRVYKVYCIVSYVKNKITKSEVKKRIDEFFKSESYSAEEVKSIKRMAMRYKIRLGEYRKLFCKKCLSKLKGRLKVSKTHKTVKCVNCNAENKHKII